MDAVDQTQAREETFSEAFQRFGKGKEADNVPQATGYCLYCGEALDESADRRPQDNRHPQDRRWCSPECRDDWQQLDDALKRKGL